MMQELVVLLGSVSVLVLLVTLVVYALDFRRRGLSWVEALCQWWVWLRTELSANPRHSRQSRIWRTLLALVWVGAIFIMPHQAQPVSAQVDTEYYILGDEDDIFAALQAIPNSEAAGDINSRLSIVSSADGVNVYLDEWEDGYDFDPDNPGTADATRPLNEGDVLTLTEADTFVTGSQGVGGGDRLYVTGAPVSVVRTVWPDTPGPYLAGSWELYPIQSWQSSYVVPVGEDVDFSPDSSLPFEYTFLFIEAAESNTRVVVTDPTTGGLADTVLSQGENIYLPNINAGTTVSATSSIQAGLITSVNGEYDSRYYTLTPQEFLGNEYYLPVPSMQFPAGEFGGRDVDTAAYIYAFQDNTVVTIETSAGTEPPVTLDTGQVHRYVMPRISAGETQGPYGARITANNKIWILVAGDDDDDDLDWGYQALNPLYLGNNYYLPYAPANPAHITPIDNNTEFSVDWNNDDVVDLSFILDRFETRMLSNPDPPDHDATGAHIYANKKFAMAWGQDNSESTDGEPLPDYDYGYTVLPLEPLQELAPDIEIIKTVYLGHDGGAGCPGSEIVTGANGADVTYCFEVTNTGDTHLADITINDADLGITVADMTLLVSMSDPYPPLAPGGSLVYYYEGAINGDLVNTAETEGNPTDPNGNDLPDLDNPTDDDDAEVNEVGPDIDIQKTVYAGHDSGVSCAGGELVVDENGAEVTYCFEVTNTGDTYLGDITIDDADLGIDETQMTLLSGIIPLAPGDSLIYYYEGAINGDLVNTAETEGNPTDPDGNDLPGLDNPTDDDPAEVEELAPAIELAKTVYLGHDGGAGCPGSELVTGTNGADVTYCFEVTNTGDTYLGDITINDADLGIDETQMTLLSGIIPLEPGGSLVYYYEGTINGDLVNTAETEGNPTDPDGNDLPGLDNPTDDDPAQVDEVIPEPAPEPSDPEPSDPEPSDPEPSDSGPPPSAPPPAAPAAPAPTPTVEVLAVAMLPETGGFPGWFTVVLGVPIIIGVASLLNLALLGMRGWRGGGKRD